MPAEIRCGGRGDQRQRVKYGDYATSLFERKLGKRRPEVGEEQGALGANPGWPSHPRVRRLVHRPDSSSGTSRTGRPTREYVSRVGKLSPHTVNGWLRIYSPRFGKRRWTWTRSTTRPRGLSRSTPRRGTRTRRRSPTSLTVNEVPRFMATARGALPAALRHVGTGAGNRTKTVRVAAAAPQGADA